MKTLKIIGSGGHTRSLLSLIEESTAYEIEGVYDDSFDEYPNEKIGNYFLKGKPSALSKSNSSILVSIGDNKKREAIVNQFSEQILEENIIAKSAIIRNDAVLGFSNQIFPQVFINSMACIGNNCIVNSKALIEHESRIGNFCHIAVGAVICGRVEIGDNCMIGAGTIIKDGVKIHKNVIIGAGAVVVKNIEAPGTYIGNPLRKIK